MKCRNPNFGYQRIADQISLVFDIEIDKDVVRRVLARHYRLEPGPNVQSHCQRVPSAPIPELRVRSLPSGHNEPLFQFHQWNANLRILEVTDAKTVPYVPLSHPFIERLIGTVRREYLDQVPFWSAGDLERKLMWFQDYFDKDRVHRGLDGAPPNEQSEITGRKIARLHNYRWGKRCRGLYLLPAAA